MDMTCVNEIVSTADPNQWQPGDAWLAGGTVLYSYGIDLQIGRPKRLLDLHAAGWPALEWDEQRLRIAATCKVAELYRLGRTPEHVLAELTGQLPQHPGLDLIAPCCDSFVASFKIWNMSTVGGNVATALPAGPMTSLLAGWDAVAEIHAQDGAVRHQPVAEVVTGEAKHTLSNGELIRAFDIDAAVLQQPSAFRRISLTERGRSAVLLIARDIGDRIMRLAITAGTVHPIMVDIPIDALDPAELTDLIDEYVPHDAWTTDIHGAPAWRRAMTARLTQELIEELFPGTIPDAADRDSGDITLKGANS